jgi:folate-binding protein YgfZ
MLEGYEALRTGAAWLDLSARGRIIAAGEDRARLLHAMTTNHIEQLRPGQGCYTFFLNAQGHILSDANLLCLEDRLLVDTEPETRERVRQHLDKYIIADDVTLEDATERTAELAVEGPAAATALAKIGATVPEGEYAHASWGEHRVARLSATGQPGFRIFAAANQKSELIGRLHSAGAAAASPEAARVVRLENARPRYGEDISDSMLPQETQQMHAVHFNKGCYLGQEIVERIRSRGHVNRLLVPVLVESSEAPLKGSKLTLDGKEAGEITSAAFSPALGKSVALAYIRAECAQPKARLLAGDHAAQLM